MTKINTLLELRNKIKGKKPEFIRQDSHKKKLARRWRKPKGIHSKLRLHKGGKGKMPSPGYKSPLLVRGIHSSGLKAVLVENEKQIPDSGGIIISSRVGMKKKVGIVKKAKENRIKILNLDADKFLKSVEDFLTSKKQKPEKQKDTAEKKKPEDKKEKEKVSSPKEETFSKSKEEGKKEKEKREKEKILIKKAK